MLKKYAPYILLMFAALVLYFVKTHQRNANQKEHLTIDAATAEQGFDRKPEKITYTRHGRCRMECRHITEEEVKEILENGKVNVNKIEEDNRGKTYPIEGKTATDKYIRIVVAPKKNETVIVTVIDLDKDWPCDCN